MLDAPSFLNVVCSATGRRWVGPSEAVERAGLAVAQALGVPEVLGRVLAGRGVSPEGAAAYLEPTLRDLMPDPSTLPDMDVAAERLAAAVTRGERVAVFGDYDVDGAASAALLALWLRAFGIAAAVHIPDRIDEGYGPNVPAMTALAGRHRLIVCVDCGSVSEGPIAAARAAGADVLVADHHLCDAPPPSALAVVNANRADAGPGPTQLCAAGVVFLLLVAANRVLRRQGRPTPDLMAMLDLVALATVADVAPLTGLNRAFVRQGLSVMARRRRPGLRALADVARLSARPSAFHLGFLLGPRVNAGGRIGEASLGVRLLSTEDEGEAGAIAARLDALNAERRAIEAAVLEAAAAQAEARGVDGPLVWAAGEGWHPGVVGIVASRLKEKFNRPAVVVGVEAGEGKGSGRSIDGVDLGASVARLAAEGLALKGGGHRMAAGLTVAEDRLEAAMARLAELLDRQGAAQGGPADLRLDGALAAGGATAALCDMLDAAGPWGAGAPAPRFAFPGLTLHRAAPMGEAHLRLTVSDGSGRLDAVAFRAADAPLGRFLLQAEGGRVHLAGRLDRDDWGGRARVRLLVDDAAPAGA